MMSEFIQDVVIPFIVISAIVLIPTFGGSYLFLKYSCAGFSKATGIPTKMIALECYAQVDGKWVPRAYVFGEAKELRIK